MSELLDILRRVASAELSPEQADELIQQTCQERELDPIQAFAEQFLASLIDRNVEESYYLPHKADDVRSTVSRCLRDNEPLSEAQRDWLLMQLNSRDPVVPNRPHHRTRSRDEFLRLDSFIHWWLQNRKDFKTDKDAILRAASVFGVSARTIENWLSDEHVFRSLKNRERSDLRMKKNPQ